MSLWGDEFEVPSAKKEVKKVAKKVSSPKDPKVETRKAIKSKTVSTFDKLQLIYEEVNRVLGGYTSNTKVITSKDELSKYIDEAIRNGIIAIDTETNNSLEPLTCLLMGACIYTPGQLSAYIPIHHTQPDTDILIENQLTELDIKEQFDRLSNTHILMHNGKFDYEVIKCTCNCVLNIYWDTEIAARILDENELAGLKKQYILHIDSTQEKYDIEHLFQGIPYAYVKPEIFALYAATDAYITYRLYEWQKEQFNKPGNEKLFDLFMNVEMPVVPVCAEMELYGIEIDKEYAKRLSNKYHKKVDEVNAKIDTELSKYSDKIAAWRLTKEANYKERNSKPNKAGEFTYKKSKNEQLENPPQLNSPTQLAILLYDILGTPTQDKKAPRGTGEEILQKIKLPICDLILEKRGLEKLIGTYIDKIPECVNSKDNRLHAHFNQLGAGTGRFSCISKGTKISSPSGDKNIEDMQPGDWVYCYDEKNNLTLSKVKNKWYTGNRNCVKLTWVSKYNKALKGTLICTPDHFVRTTDGWVMAKDLTPNHSILYVHRREEKENIALYAFHGQGNEEEHVWIKNHFVKDSKGLDVHHRDGNHKNNNPDNLTYVTRKCHNSIHRATPENHYNGAYNFSFDDLIRMGDSVNWELTKLPYDYGSLISWYRDSKINYILKYTESYSSRGYVVREGKRAHKMLHLPLNKSNLLYSLELSEGDIALAAGYFGVSMSEFIACADHYELLSNHNVISVEYLEDSYDVYDIEIEGFHNFIANELCVHNSSSPNLQNIPSHVKEIRLMFTAGKDAREIELENNYITVPSGDEVEIGKDVWKSADMLSVGDTIYVQEEDGTCFNRIIVSISKDESNIRFLIE